METKLVPGIGRLPYPAYRGTEPYIFISYAHDDKDIVFPEIKRFNEAGFHVWYDEGISPGNEWTDEIANALEKCAVFVVMITPVSALRKNVLNEVNFALDEDKPFLAIHLKET
ncbi:MAG: toll/interleukin-1 receptor domain-containing protein, partial [Clostridia bacterium]|nr:toll/interleukin-1 receptor domain-containing protein [Clostridia bacterium]